MLKVRKSKKNCFFLTEIFFSQKIEKTRKIEFLKKKAFDLFAYCFVNKNFLFFAFDSAPHHTSFSQSEWAWTLAMQTHCFFAKLAMPCLPCHRQGMAGKAWCGYGRSAESIALKMIEKQKTKKN